MSMQTRNQRYAAIIFKQVQDVPVQLNEKQREKYKAMAQKLPILIRTAGLAQALAFVEARGEDGGHLLLDHLATTLETGARASLLRRSREDEIPNYMRLTQETLTALLWYKRFAQSVLQTEANNQGGEG